MSAARIVATDRPLWCNQLALFCGNLGGTLSEIDVIDRPPG
jgi:hypothetical protein